MVIMCQHKGSVMALICVFTHRVAKIEFIYVVVFKNLTASKSFDLYMYMYRFEE